MTQRLMLLDSASLYFRAFYGVPDSSLTPKSRRKPENRNRAARSRKKVTRAA
jgi:hypothetical protein